MGAALLWPVSTLPAACSRSKDSANDPPPPLARGAEQCSIGGGVSACASSAPSAALHDFFPGPSFVLRVSLCVMHRIKLCWSQSRERALQEAVACPAGTGGGGPEPRSHPLPQPETLCKQRAAQLGCKSQERDMWQEGLDGWLYKGGAAPPVMTFHLSVQNAPHEKSSSSQGHHSGWC